MRTHLLRCPTVCLFLGFLASATPLVAGPDSIQVKIDSQVLKEQRSLRIHLPKDYDGSTHHYPVLYLLDGEWSFERYSPVVESLIREGSIASSPSFSWDSQLMVRTLGAFLKEGRFEDSFIYLAIGSDDFPTYLDAMEKVVPVMEE